MSATDEGKPGAVDPTREQFATFKDLPNNETIHMLNLIRLRTRAVYAEGHANHGRDMSGLDAYRAYGRDSGPIFRRMGGRQVWAGRPDLVVIGPADEHWDLAFIAEYPSADAFATMLRDPEYREAVKHRQAAVADSRLIRLKPLTPGEGFGE